MMQTGKVGEGQGLSRTSLILGRRGIFECRSWYRSSTVRAAGGRGTRRYHGEPWCRGESSELLLNLETTVGSYIPLKSSTRRTQFLTGRPGSLHGHVKKHEVPLGTLRLVVTDGVRSAGRVARVD